MRRRIDRLERRAGELQQLVKPLYTARAQEDAASTGAPPRAPLLFRSQFGEDMLLYEVFRDPDRGPPRRGYYIECGAYDGVTYAVTSVFDALGWDGLLVEPLPDLARACRESRPNARVERAALSVRGSSGTARFVHIADAARNYEASSFLPGARDARRSKTAPTGSAREVEVPLTTMDALLEAAPPPDGVDLAVIDVEGAELSLLDGFDLDRWRPRVILIEDHSMGADPELADHLTGRGCEHVAWISYNRLMIRRDEPALLSRARALVQHLAGPRAGA